MSGLNGKVNPGTNQGLNGLEEVESKHRPSLELKQILPFSSSKESNSSYSDLKVPNMQSAFRVSRSALFEQTCSFSLGKREPGLIPRAVIDSIEGLVDPTKLIVTESKSRLREGQIISSWKEMDNENSENIHPNLPTPVKVMRKPTLSDSSMPRMQMSALLFNHQVSR